jgi:hypothetical protein
MARAAARSSPSNRMLENGRCGSETIFFIKEQFASWAGSPQEGEIKKTADF